MQWLWIAIGGGLGSVLRFWMQGRLQGAFPGLFPIGTFGVNILGSAVIGFLGGCFASIQASEVTTQLRLFLMVGFLGGFTTFSSFSLENFHLLKDGEGRLMALYLLSSNVLGVLCAMGGFLLAKSVIRSGA